MTDFECLPKSRLWYRLAFRGKFDFHHQILVRNDNVVSSFKLRYESKCDSSHELIVYRFDFLCHVIIQNSNVSSSLNLRYERKYVPVSLSELIVYSFDFHCQVMGRLTLSRNVSS